MSIQEQWSLEFSTHGKNTLKGVPGMHKKVVKEKVLRKDNVPTQKFKLTLGALSYLKRRYSL